MDGSAQPFDPTAAEHRFALSGAHTCDHPGRYRSAQTDRSSRQITWWMTFLADNRSKLWSGWNGCIASTSRRSSRPTRSRSACGCRRWLRWSRADYWLLMASCSAPRRCRRAFGVLGLPIGRVKRSPIRSRSRSPVHRCGPACFGW